MIEKFSQNLIRNVSQLCVKNDSTIFIKITGGIFKIEFR